MLFQHTAARRRLASYCRLRTAPPRFQHTAARRRLVYKSTPHAYSRSCFNTQPPEGGWNITKFSVTPTRGFNTQPPEGGWAAQFAHLICEGLVSTHSRPKAAGGFIIPASTQVRPVSTHSRPKAAGTCGLPVRRVGVVSTHSRPKAAGSEPFHRATYPAVSIHSRPKAAGTDFFNLLSKVVCFNTQPPEGGWAFARS